MSTPHKVVPSPSPLIREGNDTKISLNLVATPESSLSMGKIPDKLSWMDFTKLRKWKMKENKKWIQGADIKKDALRKKLKVKEGHNIPESKLKKASHSKNATTKKEAVLAETFKKMREKK